jgi:hypothetical protein
MISSEIRQAASEGDVRPNQGRKSKTRQSPVKLEAHTVLPSVGSSLVSLTTA